MVREFAVLIVVLFNFDATAKEVKVYGKDGSTKGYTVEEPYGGVTIYDKWGKRQGYTEPAAPGQELIKDKWGNFKGYTVEENHVEVKSIYDMKGDEE